VHCIIKRFWKKEGMAIRGSRRKQLLDEINETRSYWQLKEEALDFTLWRISFGKGYGPVVGQAA
jgi:hypothetical protein